SVEQVKRILGGVRELIAGNPRLENTGSYFRLMNFAAEALELELFVYVLTNDPDEFRAVRENLLLEIAALVESVGSALAPTRFVAVDGSHPASVVAAAEALQPAPVHANKPS